MRTVPNTAEAYTAGFIDADGCLSVTRAGRKRNRHIIRIQANCMDRRAQRWLLEHYGGSQWVSTTPSKGTTFYWSVDSLKGEGVLKSIYPFLILKKPQAALQFKVREITRQMPLTQHRVDLLENLVHRINFMNERGKVNCEPEGRPRPDWLPEEVFAYAAGFFDGDGWVSLRQYSPGIFIQGKAKTVPEWFLAVFGGNLPERPFQNAATPNSCPQWRWGMHGDKAVFLYQAMESYMILKTGMMIESELTQ